MDKYLITFKSFELVHFLMPIFNHSKSNLLLQVTLLCLSIIHKFSCNPHGLLNYIFSGGYVMVLNKKTNDSKSAKIIKKGNSRVITISEEFDVLLGRKIEAKEIIGVERLSKNKLVLVFNKKDIPND